MLEAKLAFEVNELLNNYDPRKKQFLLETIGELLLNVSYFKMFMENYPDLGPLMYLNLINNLSFKKYKERSIIWDYNDPVDGVYIIISGEVKIYKPPDKSYLIRCINKNKKKISNPKKINNVSIFEQFAKINEIHKPMLKLPKFSLNFLKKRSKVFGAELYKQNKQVLVKKHKHQKNQKCPSAKYFNIFNLDIKEYNNISFKEQQISLTEKNYLFREPQETRRLDYIEKFGKMIGEDALLQEITHRKYACEAATNCILAFLNERYYHIFFDKINNTTRGAIISFLYKLNYFNNKNDFIHKLCKAMRLKTYKKGTFLYKKNMPFLYMYILKSGTVAINILKISKYKSDMNPDLIINSQNMKRSFSSLNEIKKINKDKETFERFTKERTFELNGEYSEKKVYTLVNYGRGEILGNIEYYLNLNKYLFSAKCLTDVEFYEIEMNTFRDIQKPNNIEFFDEKTRQQIKYFRKRINEINIIHKKNDEDQYTSRNKFMKIFFQRHPLSSLKINEKYINNGQSTQRINLRYKNKKFKKTNISPFSLYEFASALSNYKNKNTKNLFITNNNNFTKIFNGSNVKSNSLLNSQGKENNNKELISINNIKKITNKEISLSLRNSSSARNFLEKNQKLNYNKFKHASSFSISPEIFNFGKQKIYFKRKTFTQKDFENNKLKNTMRASQSTFNFKFLNSKKSVDFMNALINVYQKVEKDNLEMQEQKLREKQNKIEKKKEISNMIAFKGYQVYLNKNKKNRIRLSKKV